MKIIHFCPLSFHFSLNWFSMCYSLTCFYFRVVVYVTFPEHSSSSSVFIEVHLYCSVYYCVNHCVSFLFWPLCCPFFFDLRLLITPCVSLNFSSLIKYKVFLFSHDHYSIILNITSEVTSPIQNFLGAAVS